MLPSGDCVETPEASAARFLNSLVKPSHILVAISGGGDSVGLLVALAEAIHAGNHAHRLSAATVDHGLRAASAGEARDVAMLCADLDIPHHVRRWEGDKPQSGLMAAAREARYELLADMAEAGGADLIVTGHTFDDQQETLTMRGARVQAEDASLSRGIADAMLFDRRCWVVRPFLKCRRSAIRDFLVGRGIGWIDDPSNENMHYERVRVRAMLQAVDTVPRIADRAAVSRVSARAAGWLDEHVRVHGGLLAEIARDALGAEPVVIRYALGHVAAAIGGQPFGPGRTAMGGVLEFLQRGEAGRRTAGGVVFDLRRDKLYIVRENRNIAPLWLPAGGRGVWDGRFDVSNDTDVALLIVAGNPSSSLALSGELPKGVAQRARLSAPVARFAENSDSVCKGEAVFSVRLAPFDRFLTRLDYSFADRLAASFGRTPYLSPPL